MSLVPFPGVATGATRYAFVDATVLSTHLLLYLPRYAYKRRMSAPEVPTDEAAAAARARLHAAIGERVRAVRERLGVGQAECARGAGIDTSSMFRLEKGGQNVTAETLARLAVSLGVTIDELLVGVEADPDLAVPRTRG